MRPAAAGVDQSRPALRPRHRTATTRTYTSPLHADRARAGHEQPPAAGRASPGIWPATASTWFAAAPGCSPDASCSCRRTSRCSRTALRAASSSSVSTARRRPARVRARSRTTRRTPASPLPRDAGGIDDSFVNPHVGAGDAAATRRSSARRGLFADFEGIYVKGDDEIIIRDVNFKGNGDGARRAAGRTRRSTRSTPTPTKVAPSTRRSSPSLNGTLKGGHVVTASFTVADKKNINDDFSPALTDYPNDPADIEAEYGRGRAPTSAYRFVASGVIPAAVRASPSRRSSSTGPASPGTAAAATTSTATARSRTARPACRKFSEDGPSFAQRQPARHATRSTFGNGGGVDLIAEVFNLFNRVNYDVNSVDQRPSS